MRKVLENCPTCSNHHLLISEIACVDCGTVIRSQYKPTIFGRLSAENLRFVEIFVKNKGNVKEMERELGVSYWAIRSRLNDVISELGFDDESPPPVPANENRQEILDQLERGELSVAEAAEKLNVIQKN